MLVILHDRLGNRKQSPRVPLTERYAPRYRKPLTYFDQFCYDYGVLIGSRGHQTGWCWFKPIMRSALRERKRINDHHLALAGKLGARAGKGG